MNEAQLQTEADPHVSRHATNEDPSQFLDLYGDYLYGYAFVRLRDAELAEDVVQETLLKAFRKFNSYRGDAKVRTWLTSILRNEISLQIRKNRKSDKLRLFGEEEKLEMSDLLRTHVSGSDFESAIEREEFWTMIRECYKRVPEHLLQVFLARSQSEGASTEELCNNLGISPSNFSVRMFRTRLLLRKCIEEKWMNDRFEK